MINPSEIGKTGEMVRLRTLESIWVQGKLRMWGRWSYIGGGSGGNMFNQLLASGKITKTAIKEALRRMKKAGISKPELEAFFKEIQEGQNKSGLAFCNQHAKQQIALESQRTEEDIKVAVADDDCASRHVPAAAADRLRKYANSLRTDSGGTVASKPDY
ncbi:DUF1133 family protein [Escherichia coli]|nr:DUF1133 family protein [Escherichia coli]